MVESTSDAEQSYINNTAKNYQSRHQKFSSWAEEDRNAKPAKKCRELFLHFLSLRVLKYLQRDRIKFDTLREISILDAGCGSGRDLREFSKTYLSIPTIQYTAECEKLSDNNATCLNRPCHICDEIDLKEDTKFPKVQMLKIRGTGFDICPGFVKKCQEMGLNVILNDFVGFCQKLNEKDNPDLSDSQFHGIFTLASLFHLPKTELEKVFIGFKRHLHPKIGVLLTSIPCGNRDEEGSDGRWKLYIPASQQISMLENAGFEVIFQDNLSIYKGTDWVVLVSVPKQ